MVKNSVKFTLTYSSPPILRGFWDERMNRVKPRNKGGPRKTGDTQICPE